jgi:hypothetical protein
MRNYFGSLLAGVLISGGVFSGEIVDNYKKDNKDVTKIRDKLVELVINKKPTKLGRDDSYFISNKDNSKGFVYIDRYPKRKKYEKNDVLAGHIRLKDGSLKSFLIDSGEIEIDGSFEVMSEVYASFVK